MGHIVSPPDKASSEYALYTNPLYLYLKNCLNIGRSVRILMLVTMPRLLCYGLLVIGQDWREASGRVEKKSQGKKCQSLNHFISK